MVSGNQSERLGDILSAAENGPKPVWNAAASEACAGEARRLKEATPHGFEG